MLCERGSAASTQSTGLWKECDCPFVVALQGEGLPDSRVAKAIASRLEAFTSRVEAIASRVKAIATRLLGADSLEVHPVEPQLRRASRGSMTNREIHR